MHYRVPERNPHLNDPVPVSLPKHYSAINVGVAVNENNTIAGLSVIDTLSPAVYLFVTPEKTIHFCDEIILGSQ